jgi:hypothetical protein
MYERGKGTPAQTPETLEKRPYSTKDHRPKDWRDLYRGEDITRYSLAKAKEWVNYGPWLAAPRESELFAGPKLLMRRTDDRLMVALDRLDAIAVNSCHVIKVKDGGPSPLFCVGVLNSRTVQRTFELQNPQMVGKTFAEIKVIYVERLPMPLLDLTKQTDRARHDTLVAHVERMLKLHEELAASKEPDAQTRLQREIAATDRTIDQLVYQLYALTPEEIALVEAATAPIAKPSASEAETPASPKHISL